MYISSNEIKNFIEVNKIKTFLNASDSGIFKAISSLRKSFKLKEIMPTDNGNSRFILNLTAFDIIAGSMLLNDLNENNLSLVFYLKDFFFFFSLEV